MPSTREPFSGPYATHARAQSGWCARFKDNMFPLPFRHYPETQHLTHHHRRRRRAIVTKSKRNRSILTHIFASHISQQDPQKKHTKLAHMQMGFVARHLHSIFIKCV